MEADKYVVLAQITKIHGVNGEVVATLSNSIFSEAFIEHEPVFVDIEQIPVPFFISEAGVREMNENTLRLKFDDIDTKEEAQIFIGCKILLPESEINISESPQKKDDFEGFLLVEKDKGEIGKVAELLNFSGNLVFQVFSQGKEMLIPYNKDFINKIDYQTKTIFFTAPQGLFEIF